MRHFWLSQVQATQLILPKLISSASVIQAQKHLSGRRVTVGDSRLDCGGANLLAEAGTFLETGL